MSDYERQLDDCWSEISGLKDQITEATERNGNMCVELAAVKQDRDTLLAAASMGDKGMLARIETLHGECIALRRGMAKIHDGLQVVYQKYQHLDWLRNTSKLDPWHECVRDFMVAVAVALGYEPKAVQAGKDVAK